MHSIDLAAPGQCPARPGLLAAAGPVGHTEAQCPRHGPCYGGGEAAGTVPGEEFCVFTATARDGQGRPAVLTMVAARERAQAVLQVLSDAGSAARHAGSSEPPPAAGARRYAVVPIPGKGLGVVSTGGLGRGDLVMSEPPTLVIDHCVMTTAPQYHLAWLMNEAASRLSGAQRDRIMGLAVFGEEAPSEHYLVGRIYATNSYMLDSDDDMFGDGCGMGALFPEVSRMNHDCRPNAAYHFDQRTAKMELRAVRPIAVGEEITVSYLSPLLERAHRQAFLHDRWGFACNCAACSASSADISASDARLEKISSLSRLLLDDRTDAVPGAGEAFNGTELAELLVALAQEERLDAVMLQPYRAAALEWSAVGEREKATYYAELACEYGINSFGQRNRMVRDMQDLVVHPEQHWSWRFRVP